MTTTATYVTLSASDHSAQLRKAVIASSIGTAIEWYDFFLYGTAAGLIFGKLYFPNEDPLTGTLAAFGTYFIGFVGRPIGAAIFGHYGDRIGRKATLRECDGHGAPCVPQCEALALGFNGDALDRSRYAGGSQRLPTTEGSQATSCLTCRPGREPK